MSFDIRNKVILITGANRGIGKTLTESFLDYGVAKVYAAVRTMSSVDSLVEKYGDRVVPLELDLSEPASIARAAETASDVEVVVNNAGVLKTSTPMESEAIESLKVEMDVNVYGLIRMAQAFAPVLKANGGGVFAQINSVASLRSPRRFATYGASKAAAYSITQALRQELAEQGTFVMSVHPGPIVSDMAEEADLMDIAEPPSLVADAMLEGFRNGEFLVLAGSLAERIGGAYRGFSKAVIESD